MTPQQKPPNSLGSYELDERAAIIEYMGNIPREMAEALAIADRERKQEKGARV